MIYHVIPGLGLCYLYTDPTDPLTTAGEQPDDLDRDLYDLSQAVRFSVWIPPIGVPFGGVLRTKDLGVQLFRLNY